MRIALDAMGGDFAPSINVAGALEATAQNSSLEVVLVGDSDLVQAELGDQRDNSQIFVHHTSQVIGMHEKTSALRTKRDNSISKCWELMANGHVEAVVSAGNTGAVAGAGLFTRLFLKGVKRPGIAVVLPTMDGPVVLLDVGANAACKPEHLFQYGVMGAVYAREMLGIDGPTIGLMNIGTEETKGNDLVRETREMYLTSHLKDHFKGNVEGRDLYRGTVDVVVCEGFVGNVLLKASEGVTEMLLHKARQEILSALDKERIKGENAIRDLADSLHYSRSGGAPLLGVEGTCIICHGSSDARSIRNALLTAVQHIDTQLNDRITAELERAAALVAE